MYVMYQYQLYLCPHAALIGRGCCLLGRRDRFVINMCHDFVPIVHAKRARDMLLIADMLRPGATFLCGKGLLLLGA